MTQLKPTHKFHLTPSSRNRKTGNIAVSMTSSNSCPDACPLKDKGCYAKYSFTGIHWRRTDKQGTPFKEFLTQVKALPKGIAFRHNVAGDLMGENNSISKKDLAQLTKSVSKLRAFTYTHKPLTDNNKEAIKHANDNGFTVNLSANSIYHADKLMEEKIGPVVTILPHDTIRNVKTPKGTTVVVCPAIKSVRMTCEKCMLCQNRNRKVIVGFPSHGTAKKTVDTISSNYKI